MPFELKDGWDNTKIIIEATYKKEISQRLSLKDCQIRPAMYHMMRMSLCTWECELTGQKSANYLPGTSMLEVLLVRYASIYRMTYSSRVEVCSNLWNAGPVIVALNGGCSWLKLLFCWPRAFTAADFAGWKWITWPLLCWNSICLDKISMLEWALRRWSGGDKELGRKGRCSRETLERLVLQWYLSYRSQVRLWVALTWLERQMGLRWRVK